MVACTIQKNAAGEEIFGLSTSLLQLSKPRQNTSNFLPCSKVLPNADKNLKLKKAEKIFKAKEVSCEQHLNKLSNLAFQDSQQRLSSSLVKLLKSSEEETFLKNGVSWILDNSNCDNATTTTVDKNLETIFSRNRLSPVLRYFLESNLTFQQYTKTFEECGILTDTDLRVLDEDDLKLAGISSQEHRRQILSAIPTLLGSDKFILYKWLQQFNLESTWEVLLTLGVTNMERYSTLEPSTSMLDVLQLNNPIARKRFLLSIKELQSNLKKNTLSCRRQVSTPTEASQSDSRTSVEAANEVSPNSSLKKVSEKTLAVGYWAKPNGLKGATSDFLCVQAALRGSADLSSPAYQLEFMVDSGSDVVTCRPEVLSRLGVKFLGKIESRGIHATVEKEIYQGYLQLGGQIIPVEVMPESYESVGNQVMRHFKHYITGDQHYWLQANQDIPKMASPNL